MFHLRWRLKQRLARPGRYYGDGGTIHHSGWLDVETHHGTVVAVWFRCAMLPFNQREVDAARATEMERVQPRLPQISGIEVVDQ
jgi:hypothetical protein